MGAPVGNQNARQAKIWQQAIKRALARLSNESVDKGLDLIADKLVASAAEGDLAATREIAERMDGKAAQSLMLSGEDGGPVQIQKVERVIVHANADAPHG